MELEHDSVRLSRVLGYQLCLKEEVPSPEVMGFAVSLCKQLLLPVLGPDEGKLSSVKESSL